MKRVAGVLLAGWILAAPALAVLGSMPAPAETGAISGSWAGAGGDAGAALDPTG